MGLVSCPECGKSVSDKAISCPNCGFPFSHENGDGVSVSEPIIDSSSTKKGKKTETIIVAVLVVLFITAWFGYSTYKTKKAEQYKADIAATRLLIVSGAAEAEDACNLIISVWKNSIYNIKDETTNKYTRDLSGFGAFYEDFNDALNKLFSDKSFQSKISSIKSYQDTVTEKMKKMTNPPDEYRDAYISLKEMYNAYLTLSNLAISPEGSFTTYSDSFKEADSAVLKYFNELELYSIY